MVPNIPNSIAKFTFKNRSNSEVSSEDDGIVSSCSSQSTTDGSQSSYYSVKSLTSSQELLPLTFHENLQFSPLPNLQSSFKDLETISHPLGININAKSCDENPKFVRQDDNSENPIMTSVVTAITGGHQQQQHVPSATASSNNIACNNNNTIIHKSINSNTSSNINSRSYSIISNSPSASNNIDDSGNNATTIATGTSCTNATKGTNSTAMGTTTTITTTGATTGTNATGATNTIQGTSCNRTNTSPSAAPPHPALLVYFDIETTGLSKYQQ